MSAGESSIGMNDVEVSVETTASTWRAWRALTSGRVEWWPEMQFDPVVGAPLREVWTEMGAAREAVGSVLDVVKERSLVFAWSESFWSSPLQVTFSIRETPGGAHISVRESGFSGLDNGFALAAEHAEGWRFHLSRLVQHAERKRPEDIDR
jgi:uncharacterized protein YndB with AHSA1/START domain